MFRLIALLLLLLPAELYGTTYYVSALGNDANPGTSVTQPWATIAKVNATMLHAGDSVLFRGGDTFVGNLVITSAGTPLEPIVVGSYGTGRAIINGESGTGIMVYDVGGVSVRDLVVFTSTRTPNQPGVLFYNDLPGNRKLDYVRVYNVIVHGFGNYGVFIVGNPADQSQSGYTNVIINQVVAYDNTLIGIYVSGIYDPKTALYANSNVTVVNCVAYDNPGLAGNANHPEGGIFLEDVDGGMVEYSLAYNNGAAANSIYGGPYGIWTAIANNILFQHNESHHNHSAYLDGGGFDFDGGTTNSTMQYNYSHDNDGNGYLVYNYAGAPHTLGHDVVRYNISQNDGAKEQFSINVGGVTSGPIDVYNNTFYNSVGAAVFYNQNSENVHARNNIFVSAGKTLLVSAPPSLGSVFQANDYWSTTASPRFYWGTKVYSSYSAWRTASGQETLNGVDVGLAVNPLVVNAGGGQTINNSHNLTALGAYHLQAGSPVIDKALNLFLLFRIGTGSVDFYGVSVPQNTKFDMGASEWEQ